MKVQSVTSDLRHFLQQPKRILLICSVFVFSTLLLNGTFLRLWGLHVDADRKEKEIVKTQLELLSYQAQLQQAKDPSYIERLAKDRLDLANPDDLVFVFPAE